MKQVNKNVRVTLDFSKADRLIQQGAMEGLRDFSEKLLDEAKRIVPIQEGTLSASGKVSVDNEELMAAVSFDTPYAIPQHENLYYRHAPGRRAKYLEEPLQRFAPELAQQIGRRIRYLFGGAR